MTAWTTGGGVFQKVLHVGEGFLESVLEVIRWHRAHTRQICVLDGRTIIDRRLDRAFLAGFSVVQSAVHKVAHRSEGTSEFHFFDDALRKIRELCVGYAMNPHPNVVVGLVSPGQHRARKNGITGYAGLLNLTIAIGVGQCIVRKEGGEKCFPGGD